MVVTAVRHRKRAMVVATPAPSDHDLPLRYTRAASASRPGWRNGRRSGLKIRRGNPWGFESPSRHPW